MLDECLSQVSTAQCGGNDHPMRFIRREQHIPQSVEVTLAR